MFSVFTKLTGFFSQQNDSSSRDTRLHGRRIASPDVEAPASTRLRQTPTSNHRPSVDDLEVHGLDQTSRQHSLEPKHDALQPGLGKLCPVPGGMQSYPAAGNPTQPMQALPTAGANRLPPAAGRSGAAQGQRAGPWQRPTAYGAHRRTLVPTAAGQAAKEAQQQDPSVALQTAGVGQGLARPAAGHAVAVPPPPAAGVFMHATPSKPISLVPVAAAMQPSGNSQDASAILSSLPAQDSNNELDAAVNDRNATPVSLASAKPQTSQHPGTAGAAHTSKHPLVALPSPRLALACTPNQVQATADPWQPSTNPQSGQVTESAAELATESPAMPALGKPVRQPPLPRQLFASPRVGPVGPGPSNLAQMQGPVGLRPYPAAGPAPSAAAIVATRKSQKDTPAPAEQLDGDLQPHYNAASCETPAKPRCQGWNPRVQWLRFTELDIQDEIGEGASGKVYCSQLRNGGRVAVKIMRIKGGTLTLEFRREVDILSSTPRHQNILRLLAACYETTRVALVTEYCSNGSLYSMLHTPDAPPLSWQQLLQLWLGIARGMAHLHGCSPPILHRDLKSANVLLDSMMAPKICDFGLSRAADARQGMTVGLGTYQWMAPEVIGEQQYSLKADVYSFAIIMWECLARALPYQGMATLAAGMEVMYKGLRPPIPAGTPDDVVRLMQHAWSQLSDQRPTFAEVADTLEIMLHNWPAAQLAVIPPAWRAAPAGETQQTEGHSVSLSASSGVLLTTGPSAASQPDKQGSNCNERSQQAYGGSHHVHGSGQHAQVSNHHMQASSHHMALSGGGAMQRTLSSHLQSQASIPQQQAGSNHMASNGIDGLQVMLSSNHSQGSQHLTGPQHTLSGHVSQASNLYTQASGGPMAPLGSGEGLQHTLSSNQLQGSQHAAGMPHMLSGHPSQGSQHGAGLQHALSSNQSQGSQYAAGLQQTLSGIDCTASQQLLSYSKGSVGASSSCFLRASTNNMGWVLNTWGGEQPPAQRLSAPGAPADPPSWATSSSGLGASCDGAGAAAGLSMGGNSAVMGGAPAWPSTGSASAVANGSCSTGGASSLGGAGVAGVPTVGGSSGLCGAPAWPSPSRSSATGGTGSPGVHTRTSSVGVGGFMLSTGGALGGIHSPVARPSWYGGIRGAAAMRRSVDVQAYPPVLVPGGAVPVLRPLGTTGSDNINKSQRTWMGHSRSMSVQGMAGVGNQPDSSQTALAMPAGGVIAASMGTATNSTGCNGVYTGGGLRSGMWRPRSGRSTFDP